MEFHGKVACWNLEGDSCDMHHMNRMQPVTDLPWLSAGIILVSSSSEIVIVEREGEGFGKG